MKWLLDRLREDNTRSAIGQLGLIAAVGAVAYGANVETLLENAEAYTTRIVAIAGAAAAVAVQVQRIITPDTKVVAEMPAGLPVQAEILRQVAEVKRTVEGLKK